MATKRSAPSDRKLHSAAPSNKRFKSKHASAGPALQHATTSGRAFKKAHPVNELKSQIRSLRRLLARPDAALRADVRVEKERALRTAEHDLAAAERAQRRSAVIARWHKIRFFERQKATKRLKKARKLLSAAGADDAGSSDSNSKDELRRRVRDAEAEVNYALFYPLELDYVPLFPTRNKDGAEVAEFRLGERQGDPEMWERVKTCMAEGTLEALREGRLDDNGREDEDVGEMSSRRTAGEDASGRGGRASTKRKAHTDADGNGSQASEESDNESGGGFFE